eukprot:7151616-Pyramimonas_sp.AAC.1
MSVVRNPRGEINVGQYVCSRWYAMYVVQSTWCHHRGAIYGVQTYVVQYVLCNVGGEGAATAAT